MGDKDLHQIEHYSDRQSWQLLLEFTRLLPKVELHAHLHGCIRPETIQHLAKQRGIEMSPESLEVLTPAGGRSLSDCFKIFDMIHAAVTDLPAARRITLEALHDMDKQNVRYAELRTTPRRLPDGTTRRQYLENVLEVFREFENSTEGFSETADDALAPQLKHGNYRLVPRLLVSVDRSKGVHEAREVAELAVQLKKNTEWGKYVLGMDFSGNPTKGLFQDFRPAFELARRAGLKITVHCGEVPNDTDTQAAINFRPERLGHAVVLGEAVRDYLLAMEPPIPIEICPTSNLLTLSLDEHREHPTVALWMKQGYPFSINTDDSGVFGTDLSTEYAHLASSQGMDRAEMAMLACRAVQDIFDDDLRPSLAESFRRECDSLLAPN